jgi:hypothetical protein
MLEFTAVPVSDFGVRRSFLEGCVGALYVVNAGVNIPDIWLYCGG